MLPSSASPGQGEGDPEYHQRCKHQEHHEADKKRAASCLADEPFTAEAHAWKSSAGSPNMSSPVPRFSCSASRTAKLPDTKSHFRAECFAVTDENGMVEPNRALPWERRATSPGTEGHWGTRKSLSETARVTHALATRRREARPSSRRRAHEGSTQGIRSGVGASALRLWRVWLPFS